MEKKKRDWERIWSKGNYGFQEVLDDFENAEFIYIVTYNISSDRRDELLDLLIAQAASKPISLVTNIPKRFESYYTRYYKNLAAKQIKIYKEKLDFQNVGPEFEAAFDFDNHSKIIMTNNVAYIGSQNYSQESKYKRECGVIIRDKEEIKDMAEEFRQYLLEETVNYYKKSLRTVLKAMQRQYISLQSAYIDFRDGIYAYDDEPYIKVVNEEERYYINPNTVAVTVEELSDLYNILESSYDSLVVLIDEFQEELEQEFEEILYFVEQFEEKIKKIEDDVYDQDLHDYLNFDVNDYASDLLSEEYSAEAFDEMLDVYMDECQQSGFDRQTDLYEENKSTLLSIDSNVRDILQQLKSLISVCIELLDTEDEIDNTK